MSSQKVANPTIRGVASRGAILVLLAFHAAPVTGDGGAALVHRALVPVTARHAGAPGRGPAQAPIDHDRAAALFAEARALEGANPWAGPLYGPLLFVEPGTRYVVANEADAEGILQADGDVFVGTLPEGEGIANTAVSWAGKRWTMVMWPLPDGYFDRRRLVGHELFHRLGPEIGIPMASPMNAHLDTAAGRLSFRLELRALTRALATSGAERQQAIEDALAFRARRHREFPQGAAEERALELNEGLAEYTGIRVALPEGARAGWAVQRMETRDTQAGQGNITRNFAYADGPGYGLLLDAAMPGWHASVDEASDLGALLAEAYGVDIDAARDADTRPRVARYDGAALERFESERETARRQQQAEFRARYIDGPVLTLPVDEEFGYSFNPNGVAALDGAGQVLSSAEVRGGWGTLEVTGGVLLRRDERGIVGVVVPAPSDPAARPLTGEGWTLDLRPGWEVTPGERPGDWMVRSGEDGHRAAR